MKRKHKNLIGALASAGVLLVVRANTVDNAFVSASGEGIRPDGDGRIVVHEPEGPSTVHVNTQPGWNFANPDDATIEHHVGETNTIRLVNESLEGEKIITIVDDWRHTCDPTGWDEHVRAPTLVFGVPAHTLAIFTDPDIGVFMATNNIYASAGEDGLHKGGVKYEKCNHPDCRGRTPRIEEGEEMPIPAPDHVPGTVSAGGLVLPGEPEHPEGFYLLEGQHMLGYSAYQPPIEGGCEKCGCGVTTNAVFDVCKLSVFNSPYLGLDLTDAGKLTNAVGIAQASYGYRPENTKAAYRWEFDSSTHGVIAAQDDEAGSARLESARPAEPSDTYQGDKVVCHATLTETNPPDGHNPCTASADVSSPITVVRVDVTVEGVPEALEESYGAFTYYVPDDQSPIWTEEWTNALMVVKITCEPHDGPMAQQKVTLEFPDEFLWVKNESGEHETAKHEYTVAEVNATTFWLHGHRKSAKYKGDEIIAKHEVSGATDKVLITVFGRPWLVPDYDRKNGFDDTDETKAKGGKVPFRFWINDDDDSGDSWTGEENFLPIMYRNGAINEHSNNQPGKGHNYSDDKINGYSDLLDFSAVLVDVMDVFPDDTPDNIKDETRWHFTSACGNVVYTDLELNQVETFQTVDHNCYGRDLKKHVYEADVEQVQAELSASDKFNERLKEKKKGIILIEGCGKGDRMRIRGKTDTGFDICIGQVLLSISPVENMYRWLDLRSVGKELLGESHSACKCADTLCNGMDEPSNNPDSNCNGDARDGRHIVFVHGYNINSREATAWGAEMFKRLWQSGSTSLFTVADWVGDAGQFGNPDDGKSVSYYYAVPNAFLAAEKLQMAVNDPSFQGNPVLMAHSLGNVVVSSAIVDWKMRCSKYYLLNAAVAIQAYEERRDYLMIEDNWLPIREKYFASYWYKNFTKANGYDNDFRSKLYWCGRFGKIDQAVSYFSPSDDIVHNIKANSFGIYTSQSAWTLQERLKGRVPMELADKFVALYTSIVGSNNPKFLGTEAGWGFNESRVGIIGKLMQPSTDINIIPFKELIKEPIFCPFKSMSERMNSTALFEYKESDREQYVLRAKLLGSAIPATCFATGANALEQTPSFPYQDYVNENWPRRKRNWFHSDLKNVAYFFNRNFFDEVVSD